MRKRTMKDSKAYTIGYLAGLLGLEAERPTDEEGQVDFEIGQQDAEFFLMEALGREGEVTIVADGLPGKVESGFCSRCVVSGNRNLRVLVG